MMILNSFSFFKDKASIGESEILHNPNMGQQLLLQVSGTYTGCSMSVMGTIENNENYTKLAVIDMTIYSMLSSINKNGIFTVSTDGIAKIKIVLNSVAGGSVSVFGKLGY